LTEQNSHGLAWFLTAMPPERQALDSACALARSLDESEALALLLESLHRQFPSGAEKTFDL